MHDRAGPLYMRHGEIYTGIYMKVKIWIHAFRLRTLPLSLSGVICASLLAAADGQCRFSVAAFAVLTTLSLQILSNLANDYGDSVAGADTAGRIGPVRAVQGGLVTRGAMKRMIAVFAAISCVFGAFLIVSAFGFRRLPEIAAFGALGIAAVAAAVKYTVGENPYGYKGFGDIFVLIFFGYAGLLGTYYLHAGVVAAPLLLPATSIGLLSVGVLNLNNMRDRENDAAGGKRTIAVKLGARKAKIYHAVLIVLVTASAAAYVYVRFHSYWQLLALAPCVPPAAHLRRVLAVDNPAGFDPELKKLSLATLFFAVVFGTVFLVWK